MRRYTFTFIILSLLLSQSSAFARPKEAEQIFYKANAYYEKQEYAKAIEGYLKVLDMGLESGNLYYNIGNGFLKLGKVGYSVLCYEKAKRLTPGDGDLRSNLDYAKSLIEEAAFEMSQKNIFIRSIERPFKDFNLNTLAILAAIFYLIVLSISISFILNPTFASKGKPLFLILFVVFLLNLATVILRYYDEEILRHGVVIHKEVECKYEPIDKSTTYYKLYEGSDVIILKTRNDWRQIKRLDGKIAWVNKEAVEEI